MKTMKSLYYGLKERHLCISQVQGRGNRRRDESFHPFKGNKSDEEWSKITNHIAQRGTLIQDSTINS